MSPDERRESIVSAARAVIARKGVAAATVRDIAAELGTSSGLIHHYVESMDDLLAEAFERAADEDLATTRAAVAGAETPIERLGVLIDSYGRVQPDAGMQLWLDAWSEAARRPALRRTTERINIEWQRLTCSLIEEGCSRGDMSVDDPGATAWLLLAVLDGLALQSVAHPGAVSVADARTWSRRAAERELGLSMGTLGA